MPGSGFRAPWRGRKARNSAPNPRVKDRQPRHRQAPIQSPPVEARVSTRECSCIGFFALNTHDLSCSSRLSHTHTTSLCGLFPVRRERDNPSTLLLSHPLRFRIKTRGDVKLNYMCHNILRSSKPTCGPSFRYDSPGVLAERVSKQTSIPTLQKKRAPDLRETCQILAEFLNTLKSCDGGLLTGLCPASL